MRADALAATRGIASNGANGSGIRILEVHGQLSDRLTVPSDYAAMVAQSPTALFDPHTIQLIAAFPIEMPVVVEAGIIVRDGCDVSKRRDVVQGRRACISGLRHRRNPLQLQRHSIVYARERRSFEQ